MTIAKPAEHSPPSEHAGEAGRRALTIAALGIVFGDIGTSPLYTMREAFGEAGHLHHSQAAVLGVLSLIFWSLILLVSLKYVILILRADNRGEGGVLALSTLASRTVAGRPGRQLLVLCLSIAGLALFYGDALITPAISVLSAVEGLESLAPGLEPWVVPISAAILFTLFLLQSRGTATVGRLFGPVMLLWFLTMAVLGLVAVARYPAILGAVHPAHAINLFQNQGMRAFMVLGAVVLAITGAEALYADMGHFGPGPIRRAWFRLVLPALLLNYFGQGALVLQDPAALAHPFYHLAPNWALAPLIALATVATVIASQAVISGVFSLTHQAVQLGHLSRMTIRHTSAAEMGQIYIPRVNWLLMAGVLLLVVGFGSSSGLAAAYGISVTGAMVIDALLACMVAAWIWGWRWWAILVFGGFLALDLAFLGANAMKIPSGGWLPLLTAAIFATTVTIWRRGRRVLWAKLHAHGLNVESFIEQVQAKHIRVPGTAVFLTSDPSIVPIALLHNLKHNQVLHERILLLTVHTEDSPSIPDVDRLEVEKLGKGFYRLHVRYGFMDEPNVPRALALCHRHGLAIDLMRTSFFVSRETLVQSASPEMNPLEERIFMLLAASNLPATAYFCIPPGQIVELGTQIEV
jgi:KUP system potassium uptake protein